MYVYVCMCVCMCVYECMCVRTCILQWYTQDFNSSNKSSIVILLLVLVPRARNVLPFVPWRSIVVAKAILDHDKM